MQIMRVFYFALVHIYYFRVIRYYKSIWTTHDSYPSEQNLVEFVYEIKPKRCHRRHWPSYKPRPQNPTVIKRWVVHVECICCPHKSGISYSPFQSAKSTSVHDNSKPLPLLALFPSSSASDMDRRNFNNEGDLGISIETTNIAFDTAWRRDFDPDEFKLNLPPKAIFSSITIWWPLLVSKNQIWVSGVYFSECWWVFFGPIFTASFSHF